MIPVADEGERAGDAAGSQRDDHPPARREYLRTGNQRVLSRKDGARCGRGSVLRRVFAGIRSPGAAEAAVTLLCRRAGRAAGRFLFGDGSLPEGGLVRWG
jgi:hypothetical protein